MDIVNFTEGFREEMKSVLLYEVSKNIESDLSELINLRKNFKENPLLAI